MTDPSLAAKWTSVSYAQRIEPTMVRDQCRTLSIKAQRVMHSLWPLQMALPSPGVMISSPSSQAAGPAGLSLAPSFDHHLVTRWADMLFMCGWHLMTETVPVLV